jgi:hypothetical protein
VVRIFPNTESCLRLIRALCAETLALGRSHGCSGGAALRSDAHDVAPALRLRSAYFRCRSRRISDEVSHRPPPIACTSA